MLNVASDSTASQAPIHLQRVRAYAPASIGNFAAGFDTLGAALAPLDGRPLGDVVEAWPAGADSLEVTGPFGQTLAQTESRPNLVLKALVAYRAALAEKALPCGPIGLRLEKNLPLSSGLGSSASSIVAALVALQALCGEPLERGELLRLAAEIEGCYSGGAHADNVGPSLLGGLQLLVPGHDGIPAARALPWPEDLLVVVVHPHSRLSTADSRAVLPTALSRSEAVAFASNLAGFVQALHARESNLLARCLRDLVAEPHRASLVPGFSEAKIRALELGALGCSLAGSGPSTFAVAASEEEAAEIASALEAAFREQGFPSDVWICGLDRLGARVL